MKRLNIKLLAWILVAPAVFAVGVHFLHAYQIDRNAGTLKAMAEEAVKAGDTEEAISQYTQFLKHRDDAVAYSELARLTADAAEQPDANLMKLRRAFFVMEDAVRRHGELSEVRKRLVDYSMKVGRFRDAIDHIDRLRADGALKGSEFDIKHAQCLLYTGRPERAVKLLSELLGYDQVKQEFSKSAKGATEIDPYVLLAEIYRKQQFDSKDAQIVIDQLVAANPNSARAYAERGRFYQRQRMFDKSQTDLAKALELSPDDAEIIISNAEVAAAMNDLDHAKKLLDDGLKKHPEDDRIYRVQAAIALHRKRPEEALAMVEEGLKHSPKNQSLLLFRAELELQKGEIESVQATVQQMKDGENNRELIELIECRILMAQKKWTKAMNQLEKLRPLLARSTEQTLQVDLYLGQSYLAQGQPDRAMDAFTRALDSDPASFPAQAGKAEAFRAMGKPLQAKAILEKLKDRVDEKMGTVATTTASTELQQALVAELRKPEAQRDWTEVDLAVTNLVQGGSLKDAQKAVLQGEICLLKKDFKRARGLLSAAVKEHPKELAVWQGLLNLVSVDKETKYTPEDILDRAEAALGPVFPLKQKRLLIAINKPAEEAKESLKKLELDLDDLNDAERFAFMSELGSAYYRLRDYPNAKRFWLKVVEARPDDTKNWLTLYELAQEFGAEDDMAKTLEEIRKHRGTNSSVLKLCQAQMILWKIAQKKSQISELAEAKKLLDAARKVRPQWHEIARVTAQVAELEGKPDEAIDGFRRTLELGPANPNIARRLVALLYSQNRLAEADQVMDTLPTFSDADPLKRIQIERSLRQGKLDEALVDAKKLVDADPKNPQNQLWYGQLLSREGRDEEAQKAFRSAIAEDPKSMQGWLLLVSHLVRTKQIVDANSVIREASDQVATESRDAFQAQAYEIANDPKMAEENYLALLAESPTDSGVIRNVASFYLRANDVDKGRKQIESLLALPAATSTSDSQADRANIAWARRALAQITASTNEYLDLQKALTILDGNKVNGKLPQEDMMLAAGLLARRPEYASRVQALKLLEQVQAMRSLSPEEQFVMAQLYDQTGDWSKARDTIVSILTKVEGNVGLSGMYAGMLLNHDELLEAERWIEKVEQAQPNTAVAIQLRARLLAKQGSPTKAAELIVKLVDDAPNEEARLQLAGGAAALLEELNQDAAAEKILRNAIAAAPRAKVVLAAFLGRHGNLDEAFVLLEESRKSLPLLTVIQAGIETLRRNPAEARKQHFAKVEGWINSVSDEDANSPTLYLHRAELADAEGKTEEVISAYRHLYAQTDLPPQQRTIVANNLSYVLAMNGDSKDAEEALKLINSAIDVLGPASDLIDTRAVCYLLLGDNKKAIDDARTAVVDSPTAVKYLHLAIADATSGNKVAAAKSLEKARKSNLDVNALAPNERKNYEKLIQKLKSK